MLQQKEPKTEKMVACGQALGGALAAEQEREGELAITSLEFEFQLHFPCGSPLNELSDFRQSTRKENDHLRQSAFRVDFFDTDIQIPET